VPRECRLAGRPACSSGSSWLFAISFGRDGLLAFADCAIVIEPTANQLRSPSPALRARAR
jgi:phosphotransacetylase